MAELHPWSQRAREILADGQWHPFRAVAEEAGKLIPPGQAMRRRDEDAARFRAKSRAAGRPEGRRVERSVDFQVSRGRYAMMRQALIGLTTFEYKDVDGVKYIRLKGAHFRGYTR